MKTIKIGNILDATSGLLVQGCNAQGVMGSGLAREIRAKYPKVFETYSKAATQGLRLGQVILTEISEDLIIANAITQQNFGRDSIKYVSYEAIQSVFKQIAFAANDSGIEVHYPLIGAGLGGGDWAIISEIIDLEFAPFPDVNRTLWIYEPA